MMLKTLTKALVETKYTVVAELPDGNFDWVDIDYLSDDSEQLRWAFRKERKWEKGKVESICYNKASGNIEIRISL